MIYFCCDELRRHAVRQPGTLNGIDFLEVVDHDAASESERQRLLRVKFLKDPAGILLNELNNIAPDNVLITGGERTRGVRADNVVFNAVTQQLEIHVNTRGDFSTYTLSLVTSNSDLPLPGLDLLLFAVDFSFKVECASDFDCRAQHVCPPEEPSEPEIDYLAKDFASFRQLMLDRLSLLLPEWQERNPADLGVTLVELLAYVGDHLSYEQDGIGTEAYLGTARRRLSVRRHARLVDYLVHDGCNARVWVHVRVNADVLLKRLNETTQARTRFLTKCADQTVVKPEDFEKVMLTLRPEVFEPMHDLMLFNAHNEIPFYTWGDGNCCLPRGATRATLCDDPTHLLRLRPGDVLVFVEQVGPKTGKAADADLKHRHAVRLTRVIPETKLNPDGTRSRTAADLVTDPITGQAYVEIEWSATDALPFACCLADVADADDTLHPGQKRPVSRALGNIVLADHGRTLSEPLDPVPEANPRLAPIRTGSGNRCEERLPEQLPPRYRPSLQQQPLTQVATITRTESVEGGRRRLGFDPSAPATDAFDWDMNFVRPAIELTDDQGTKWLPQRDLLGSDPFAPEFVGEVENNGQVTLRFGDDENGLRPAAGRQFTATYRVGNGSSGNIGAQALAHLVTNETAIESVSNPLPAQGGTDAESIERVRQNAPSAFRLQERAVTPQDYEAAAQRHPEVQRAAATLRWTGSWHTVFLSVDRHGGRLVDSDFEVDLRGHLERFRMAGHDLEIDGPRFVPLEIEAEVCVDPDYFRSDVLAALMDVFSNTTRPDRQRGFFHPDNFTFGQSVYLSKLYAAAQAVAGVRHLDFKKFQRLGLESRKALDDGVLSIDRLEIARLDNNPNFPERGVWRWSLKGGR